MALLVILSVLSLVSILVLAFFSQATLNRQTSFASAGQARAELMADAALRTVVGDLREEIRAGSTNLPAAGGVGAPLYAPAVPQTLLLQKITAAAMTNLYKESLGGSNFWTGGNYSFKSLVRAVPGNSTTNRSANGRYLPPARWLRPQLLTPAEAASFRPPDWVLVTRGGPATNAVADLAKLGDPTTGNRSYAIGRYAFTVYEIGGLLDANLAGYSSQSTLTPTDLARKGSLGLVNLVGIGGLTQSQVDALVKWRNPKAYNGAGVDSYSNLLFHLANTNGFLGPAPGNQGFVTRQDLISYATRNGITNALPFLTTFAREKNAPVWAPQTPTGSAINYAALAETAGSTNRDLGNARASDGSLLIPSRFDLDRLAWLTYKGPSASLPPGDPLYNAGGTDANIKKYFGLVWDSTAYNAFTERGEDWVYTSPDGTGIAPSMIKTLDQVAQAKRAPDFFELLKATILGGSLGQNSAGEANLMATLVSNFKGNNNALSFRTNNAGTGPTFFNQVPDYHVFNIGANILGQYTSDGYPPMIITPGGVSIGVKSLPYEYAHGQDYYRPVPGTPLSGGNPYQDDVYFWLRFSIWNPHRNAAAGAAQPAVGPTKFRVAAINGRAIGTLQAANGSMKAGAAVRDFNQNPAYLVFNNSTDFLNPTMLGTTNTTAESSDTKFGAQAVRYSESTGKDVAGFLVSIHTSPDGRLDSRYPAYRDTDSQFNQLASTLNNFANPMDIRFQYQDAQSRWRSYQIVYNGTLPRRSKDDGGLGPNTDPYTNAMAVGMMEWANPDPRDRRFGHTHSEGTPTDTDSSGPTNTFRSDSTRYRRSTVYSYTTPSAGATFVAGSGSGGSQFPAYFADNLTSSKSYYRDGDGIVRPGDAAGLGAIPPALSPTAQNSRPLILNAPFRTIADIGYAFRDLPWKTVDFFSTSSADAGLLELFGQYGGVGADLPVVAGKVNLNTASPAVLQALLGGAATDFNADLVTVGANTNSTADVTRYVNALRPAGTAPVFQSKADLVSFFSANTPATVTLKGQREAPVRALANVVQTRTWNVLIDVVAQAGHFAPGATGLDQFLVEGEKHYWLQVAIDRYTGEIVDQQLEPVYEQ